MIFDGKIRDEKLQNYVNSETAKISALSSGKLDKFDYFTDEEILPSNQRQIIEQDKFLLQEKLLKKKQKQLKIKE